MTAIGLWAYANHDRLELLDSDIVSDRAQRACEQLRASLPTVTQDSSASPTPASVREETFHVRTLVSDVRSVGATALAKDLPAEDWLADWERLATLRDEYANELERDSPARRPTMPTVDGYALAHRMGSVGVVGCNVPLQILDDFDLAAPTTNRAKTCESSEDAPMCIDKDRVTFTGLAAGSRVDVIIMLGTERTRVLLTADQRGAAEALNPAPPGMVVTVFASAIAKWTGGPVTYALAAQPA